MNSRSTARSGRAGFGTAKDQTTNQTTNGLNQPNCSGPNLYGGRCLGTTDGLPFAALLEKDISGNLVTNIFQSISSGALYTGFSHEEIRLVDYNQNGKGRVAGTYLPLHSFPDLSQFAPKQHGAAATQSLMLPPGLPQAMPKSVYEPRPSEKDVRMTQLEEQLQRCQIRLTEATHAKAQLETSHRTETEHIFVLTQELAQCERRTAKAEIAVQYLAELNVQVSTEVKKLGEPDQRIGELEKQLQNANYDAEMRILALEMEIQNLTQENEKLKSKLENAMDTILGLSIFQRSATIIKDSNVTSQTSHAIEAKVEHNNLIDLMDECLTPTKNCGTEEQTAPLLNDAYDLEDEDVFPAVEETRVSLNLFDNEFAKSSYIIRFKDIRDMTKHGQILDTPVAPVPDKARTPSLTSQERRFEAFSESRSASEGDKKVESSSDQSSVHGETVSTSASCDSDCKNVLSVNSIPPHDKSYTKRVMPSIASDLPKQNGAVRNVEDPSEIIEENNIQFLDTSQELSIPEKSDKVMPFRNETEPTDPKLIDGTPFSVFKSEMDKQKAITSQKGPIFPKQVTLGKDDRLLLPAFFTHGLQYQPSQGDRNAHRTVLVSNLPPDMTLLGLLNGVHCGIVYDAQLLNTTKITGTCSALVTFLDGLAALAYEQYAKISPIMFQGLIATVSVLTPTWPLNPLHRKEIIDRQQTRCLEIHNFPTRVSSLTLERNLRTCPSMRETWIIYKYSKGPGLLELHFSSIERAILAYDTLSKLAHYRGSKMRFIPDPCAEP